MVARVYAVHARGLCGVRKPIEPIVNDDDNFNLEPRLVRQHVRKMRICGEIIYNRKARDTHGGDDGGVLPRMSM